jgi:hypothetical protein
MIFGGSDGSITSTASWLVVGTSIYIFMDSSHGKINECPDANYWVLVWHGFCFATAITPSDTHFEKMPADRAG